MRTKTKPTYYVLLIKSTNKIVISLTKQGIANELGTYILALNRMMNKLTIYDTDTFTIWKNISIPHVKRGYALRSRY